MEDIASRKLVIAYPVKALHEALDKICENRVRRLPAADRSYPSKIVEIISRHDVLKAFEIAAE